MKTPDPAEKPSKPLPASMRDRKPWPMWPIALSIAVFIGIYTVINFQYRKEGKAYEPFQAMMERKNAIVEKNMYDWYSLKARRTDDNGPIALPASATSQANPHVLDEEVPEQLKYYMATRPILVPGFVKAESPASHRFGEYLRLRLHTPAGLADDERLKLLAFYKEGDLYLLATLFVDEIDDIADSLTGEPTPIAFEIPTEPIETDQVNVKFLSDGRLAKWQIAKAPVSE